MQQILILFHLFICIGLIGLVLIQHGKGADMGAGFGSGASQTMFGSAGATPFLVKLTGTLAALFFISCLAQSYLIKKQITTSTGIDITKPITSQPSNSPVPLSKVKQAPQKSTSTKPAQ